jgi:hypothetical protein
MNFSDPADAMASQLLDAYETEIPSTGHPHVLTAVDNSLLEDVKTAWDQTAYYIDQLFTTDPSSTKGNLLTAYKPLARTTTPPVANRKIGNWHPLMPWWILSRSSTNCTRCSTHWETMVFRQMPCSPKLV